MPTGYLWEYCPEHPACNLRGHVPQHRLVMERHLGRFLAGTEVVHHKNGVKDDNRLENLEVFPSQADHIAHHQKESKTKDPEFVARLRELAEDPTVTVEVAKGELQCSHQSIHNALTREGIQWRSAHNEGVRRRRISEDEVLQILQEHSRKEAAEMLEMSVMSLWRHFPEGMRKTARKKSLKSGGPQGETESSGRPM